MKIDCDNDLESKSFTVINLFENVSEVCQNIDDICLHKYQHLIFKNCIFIKYTDLCFQCNWKTVTFDK